MNSGSGQSYMDKLKARNIPPALQEAMEEPAPEPRVEQEIPMVQISAEEWMRLMLQTVALMDDRYRRGQLERWMAIRFR